MTIGNGLVEDAPAHRRASRSVRDLPAAERPRERLAMRGPGGLSAAELIAVVWGTGAAGHSALELAEQALARHASVGALARASDAELAGIPGVGAAKAARLAAAFELGRRSVSDWPAGGWTIRSPRDVAERLMVEMGRLERYLGILATIAAVSPFVGLFGTVWGIIDAFQNIGHTGNASLATVAIPIAEALVATAFGLVAAIPALMAYNFFQGQLKQWQTELDDFSLEFIGLSERNFT